MVTKVRLLSSLAQRRGPLESKEIWEAYGEALPQVHMYRGVYVYVVYLRAVFSRIKCRFTYISVAVWVRSEALKRILNYPHFLGFGSCCGVALDDGYSIPKPAVAPWRLWTFGHESRREAAWKESLKHKRCRD